jgi:hypothetical protein
MLHSQPNVLSCVMLCSLHAIMPVFRMYRASCRIVVYLLRRDLAISLYGDVIVGREGVDCVCGELGTVYGMLTSRFKNA